MRQAVDRFVWLVAMALSIPLVAVGCSPPHGGASVSTSADASSRAVDPTPASRSRPMAQTTFVPEELAFWDEHHGIAAGEAISRGCGLDAARACRGEVRTTSDGGRSWSRVLQTRFGVSSVTVLGRARAWVSSQELGVLVTSNRGRTWRHLSGKRLSDLSFVSPNRGWASLAVPDGPPNAYTIALASTQDGGRSWRWTTGPCAPVIPDVRGVFPDVAGVSFTTEEHGWVLCAGEPYTGGSTPSDVFETRDGGVHWAKVSPGGGRLPRGIFFGSDVFGWMPQGEGPLMTSSDGGHIWISRGVGDTGGPSAESAWFLSERLGWALRVIPGVTSLLRTTTGGASWRVLTTWRYG